MPERSDAPAVTIESPNPQPRHCDAVEPLEARVLLSTYYVATGGSDDGEGTLASPFRTVQHAAALARAGDAVLIRGGTYRETISPANSGSASAPIVFKPYNGESVTISGADPVSGWQQHKDSIYKTPMPWNLGEGRNQIFVDGRMMNEARWPNTSLDVSHPATATADSISHSGGNATLSDSALTQSYWAGAMIHIAPGQGWVVQTGRVTSSASGRLGYSYQPMSGWEVPTGGDPYYLTGKFQALDSAGEWYRDPTDSKLYLWAPDGSSPGGHTVEAKHRQYAFNLSGKSNITIDDIGIFAAGIMTGGSSGNIVLDRLNARYLSHDMNHPTGWSQPPQSGIVLNGSHSVLQNSTLSYSSGDGIFLNGNGNRVQNNVIRDMDYAGTDTAPVRMIGGGHVVSGNTIYNAGRSGIKFSHAPGAKILNNVIHDVMLQTTDGGGVYTYGTNGANAEVAYNKIYNVLAGGFGGTGLFLDNNSSNYSVHHNIVYRANNALKMNPSSRNNIIYNNTLSGTDYSVDTGSRNDLHGSVFKNNVFADAVRLGHGESQINNLDEADHPRFANPAGGNYALVSGGQGIGALAGGSFSTGAGAGSQPSDPPPPPSPPVDPPPPEPDPAPAPPPSVRPPTSRPPTTRPPKGGTGGTTQPSDNGQTPPVDPAAGGSVGAPQAGAISVAEVTVGKLPAQIIGGSKKAKGSVRVRLQNNTAVATRAPVDLTLYFSPDAAVDASSDVIIGHVSKTIRIKANASKVLKIKVKFPAPGIDGNYFLLASATGDGIDGSHASAATGSQIRIEKPIVTLSGQPQTLGDPLHLGELVRTALSLTNTGNVTAKGKATIDLFVASSADGAGAVPLATITGRRISIKAGATRSLKLRFTLTDSTPGLMPGSHFLLVKLTAADELGQLNTLNGQTLVTVPFTLS